MARREYGDLVSAEVKVDSLESREISRLYVSGPAEPDNTIEDFLRPYARIYSWTGWGVSAFIERLRVNSSASIAIFPFLPGAGQNPMHTVDYYLACIGLMPSDTVCPRIPMQPGALAWARDFLHCHKLDGSRLLMVAPGSGAREKNWPVRSFAAVGDWWRRRLGGRVVVLLGPAEEERATPKEFLPEAVLVRNVRLAHAAALMALSDLYVGNDSGLSHLAAAAGASAVVLFGPSDAARWAPRGERVTVVRKAVSCSPCETAAMKACGHRSCLATLIPLDVIRAVKSLIHSPIGDPASLTRDGPRITVEPNL